MATTTFREDYLGRNLQNPTVNALDSHGRATTSTTDFLGRSLRRVVRANSTAVTLNQELQFTGGEKFIVTVAGTTAASQPSAPAVGATVAERHGDPAPTEVDMGTSRSAGELSGKLYKLAAEIGDSRRGINAAALAAKQAMIATTPVVGHKVARGRIGVRYDVKGTKNATAIVRFTGPAHLALNPTAAHRIEPRRRRRGGRRRALTIGGNVRAWANHPGTRGSDPGAARAKAAAAAVAPRAYMQAAVTDPLRRIF